MNKPYETCECGYEWFFSRWNCGEMTQEEWDNWYYNHCGRCKYFSGYHCILEN